MIVTATLRVHEDQLNVYHEFACQFKKNEIELSDKNGITSFRFLTLTPYEGNLVIEGFDDHSTFPVVQFKFEDKLNMQDFILASSSSCTLGGRKSGLRIDEPFIQGLEACKISRITEEQLQHKEEAREIVKQAEHQNL